MIGAELMRDAALLGAECVVATPADQVPPADEGWAARPEARAALRRRLQQHLKAPDAARARCEELGLDANAYWLVMLCAAVELHPEAAAAVSLIAEDAHVQLPTPTVVAKLLRGIHGVPYAQALALALDGGAAGRIGLVETLEPTPGLPHAQHPLRLAKTELQAALADAAQLGRQSELSIVSVAPAPPAFDSSYAARLLQKRGLLVIRGASRRAARQLAADLAGHRNQIAHLVSAKDELPKPAELSRLTDGLIVLDLHQRAQPIQAPALRPIVLLVDEAADTSGHATVDAPPIGYPEALRVWEPLSPDATSLAARFRVNVEEARAAAEDATSNEEIAARIRAQGARRMGRHVTVVETSTTLADLVVPEELRVQLDEIVAWQRGSHRVRWQMELGLRDPAGTGLTVLFAGKSGTGKTFAARCLAAELDLNLYRIDLSQVVSKYIGETEKALAQVFDEVEAGHGLLLFDEADALFGRRSEVKDAHDRYANIEVGYLLQRLEAYDGIAVLTTNLQGNMDAAFVRRLRFIVQFPAPDRDLRRQLWDRSLPNAYWRADDLDVEPLADRFQLTGGAIHNIGLAAAHLAAATPDAKVTLSHVLRATQRELQKTGRPADANAFGPLAPHLNGHLR